MYSLTYLHTTLYCSDLRTFLVISGVSETFTNVWFLRFLFFIFFLAMAETGYTRS